MNGYTPQTTTTVGYGNNNKTVDYTKLYNALTDLQEFNVQISVPEFVFIGFQSAGKTSAVSQAAQFALGAMKNGAASRCPTRFKLISNPSQKKPIIKVNGVLCANEVEVTRQIIQITKEYEEKDIFSKDIIEVRIESNRVAEFTFVDLPGLIHGNAAEENAVAKQLQSDELTAHFLHELNPDGSYRYIPIVVREPVAVEHDSVDFVMQYINNLVEKYDSKKKRFGWREDAIFVVNKFDTFDLSSSHLVEYMRYLSCFGVTVFTIMNAKNVNTSEMTQDELNKFIGNVSKCEEDKWQEIFAQFSRMNDGNWSQLKQLKEEKCGVSKMNEILQQKMCDIAKGILPLIEQQLELADEQKRADILYVMKQIELCDPQKLKQRCIAFNNKFIKYSGLFYSGQNVLNVSDKYLKTWAKEVDDFRVHHHQNNIDMDWKYEIRIWKLQTLLSTLRDKNGPRLLSIKLRMNMIGSAAINRIIEAWQCQIAYMAFPQYTDSDITNAANGFTSTRQPETWMIIRNIVLDAIKHLIDGIKYLGEMLRYKLKENADIIFECTLLEEFGATDTNNLAQLYQFYPNNPILKLLKQTLRDYKLLIDKIIDAFIESACDGPVDRVRILDKFLCEETINIAMLTDENLKHIAQGKLFNNNKNKKNREKAAPPHILRRETTFRYINEGEDDDEEKEEVFVDNDDCDVYDERYFDKLYGAKLRHPIVQKENCIYDISLVRHLSHVFWTNIKYLTARDAIQKLMKMVMATVNHHNGAVADAIHCGVVKQEIDEIMDALVEKTGIDRLELKKLMNRKSLIGNIPRAVNDIENDEIHKVYGINRRRLLTEKEKRIKQYKKFKKMKNKTLHKIYYLRNNDLDEWEKVFGDEYGICGNEKNVEERRVKHLLKVSLTEKDLNVKDLVLKKYKTIDDDPAEYDNDSESSYDENNQLQRMDSEAIAMQKEIAQMQNEQAAAMKKQYLSLRDTISSQYDDDNDDLSDVSDEKLTEIEVHTLALQGRDSNLFRMRSSDKWDESEVMKQKQEMEAQMVYLVGSHVKKQNTPTQDTASVTHSNAATPIEFID